MGNSNITIRAVVPADTPAGSTIPCELQTSPEVAAVNILNVPFGQEWIVNDVYVTREQDAGTSDPQIRFIKNQNITIGQTGNLSTRLVSNPSRPELKPKMGFREGSQMQAFIITTRVVTTQETITAYAEIDIRR